MCLFMCFFLVGWKDSKKISPKKHSKCITTDVWWGSLELTPYPYFWLGKKNLPAKESPEKRGGIFGDSMAPKWQQLLYRGSTKNKNIRGSLLKPLVENFNSARDFFMDRNSLRQFRTNIFARELPPIRRVFFQTSFKQLAVSLSSFTFFQSRLVSD